MEHRRLMVLFALLSLFALGVIVWYFMFSTPQPAPTLQGTVNPLSLRDLPARIGLIFQGNPPESTTETEVTSPANEPLVVIWESPTTGNRFTTKQVLREVVATTSATSTVTSTRTVRATTTTLLFVDRTTGYIYGHDLDTRTTYQISNTTLPGIYDAYIWANGTKIIMRYLESDRKSITSLMAGIPNVQAGSDPRALVGTTILPGNITSVAVSASSGSVSYLVPNETGSSVYTATATRDPVLTASLPFSELTLSYGGEQLYATTKASAYVEGSTITIPQFSRILGGKTGLVNKPSINGVSINSMWSRSGLALFGNSRGSIVPLTVQTIASKCIPGEGAFFICAVPKTIPNTNEGYPDDWYQGSVSFDDALMLVNAISGESYSLYSFSENLGEMDVIHMHTTPTLDVISFIRKQDGKLFLLNTNLLSNE